MDQTVEEFAAEVLCTPENAADWLQQPNRALDGQIPNDLLGTAEGAEQVWTILGRIAYGIYS